MTNTTKHTEDIETALNRGDAILRMQRAAPKMLAALYTLQEWAEQVGGLEGEAAYECARKAIDEATK